MTKKNLEEMNLMDNFLINALAADQEVGEAGCRCMLSVLLQRKIGKVRVHAESMVAGISPNHRGIRMDVEVTELRETNLPGEEEVVANVYDLEPHFGDDTDFPRANRFRQAKIDGRYMKSGDSNFRHFPNLYVITITDVDLFGEGRMVYTFRSRCEESPNLPYEDGMRQIYFNTVGKIGGSEEIRNMLQFMQNSDALAAVDPPTKEMESYVRKVKMDPEVRRRLMTLGDLIDREREEERKETTQRVTLQVTRQVTRQVTHSTKVDDILELLEEADGEITDSLKAGLEEITDTERLKYLLKQAARVRSVAEFEENMRGQTP